MSLTDPEKIDFIGIAPDAVCVLTIADDADWDDVADHVAHLGAKLNTYVEFIRSGEIDHAYPAAKESDRKIVVALRNAPPQSAVEFLSDAKTAIKAHGIDFSWQVFHAG
jgi:hypothetical protein